MMIHISASTESILDSLGTFKTERRGEINIKVHVVYGSIVSYGIFNSSKYIH